MDDENHQSQEEAFVINDLLKLFATYTPINLDKKLIIGIDYNNGPITLWDNLHVNLNTKGPRIYNQTVFQLAHELVHVTTHVAPYTATWFNEVLCEVGAEVFLDYMFQFWSGSNDTTKAEYAINFKIYKALEQHDIIPSDLSALRDSRSRLCTILQRKATNYQLNRPIAMQIFPLAYNDNNFWKILPYTFNLGSAESLDSCLSKLQQRLPSNLKYIASEMDALFPT